MSVSLWLPPPAISSVSAFFSAYLCICGLIADWLLPDLIIFSERCVSSNWLSSASLSPCVGLLATFGDILSFSQSSGWLLCHFLAPSSNRMMLFFYLSSGWLFVYMEKQTFIFPDPYMNTHVHIHTNTHGQPTTIHTHTHTHVWT